MQAGKNPYLRLRDAGRKESQSPTSITDPLLLATSNIGGLTEEAGKDGKHGSEVADSKTTGEGPELAVPSGGQLGQ